MKNTFQILFFIIRLKTRPIKTILNFFNSLVFLGKILMLIALILNLFVFSEVLGEAEYEDIKNIYIILLISFSVLGIIKDFVPNYIPQANYLPSSLPIGFLRRTLINMTLEFYSFFYLYFILFFGAFIVLFHLYIIAYLTITFLLIMYLIKYFIKNILESNFKDYFSLISLASFLLGSFVNYRYQNDIELTIIIGLTILTFSYFVSPFFMSKINFGTNASLTKFFGWNIILNNPTSRITIFMYMICKIAFLIFVIFTKSKFKETSFILCMFSLTISPIMLFTYFFNNIFGFLKEYWINIFLINGKQVRLIQFYLKLIIPFLLFDGIIFYIEKTTHKLPSYFSIELYLTQTITFVIIGLLGVFIKPLKVNKNTLFTNYSTAITINIFMGIILYSGVFLYANNYYLYYLFCMALINIWVLFKFNKIIRDYQYYFYHVIFK